MIHKAKKKKFLPKFKYCKSRYHQLKKVQLGINVNL